MTKTLVAVLLMLVATSDAVAGDPTADDIAYRLRMQADLANLRAVVATTGAAVGSGGKSAVATSDRTTRGAVPAADLVAFQELFEPNAAHLTDAAVPRLQTLCQAFRKLADIQQPFRIVGHTDAVGSFERNQRLSEARAEAVRRYLVDDCGIRKDRLQVEGRGEADLRPNLNPRDSQQRRIEIQVAG